MPDKTCSGGEPRTKILAEGADGRKQAEQVLGEVASILKLRTDDFNSDPTALKLSDIVRDMAANGYDADDPIRETFTCLGNKYSKLLLSILSTGTFRHSVLRRLASAMAAEKDISQRMLTLRLRELERDGFIKRKVIPTSPPAVEYSLTPLGRDLNNQVNHLVGWISSHSRDIVKSRLQYEQKARNDNLFY